LVQNWTAAPLILVPFSTCTMAFLLIVVLVLLPVPVLCLFLSALDKNPFFVQLIVVERIFLLVYLYRLVVSSSLSRLATRKH
jgi:hypothetical protein